ncbi:hypothetical protein BKA83DRAFT_4205960 [Pisolithus microcarpus]|nr:hypothetical protein BKA83DRAFT_4205960 [Pisolithus microcarpus]
MSHLWQFSRRSLLTSRAGHSPVCPRIGFRFGPPTEPITETSVDQAQHVTDKNMPIMRSTAPYTATRPVHACNWIAGVHNSIPYHELMGLPYSPNPFMVDTALLKHRFLEAQRICHPDAWATKTEPEKRTALELSNTSISSSATGVEMEEADQLDDVELIDEIMQAREEIDSVQSGNPERLHGLRDQNDAKISQLVKMIEGLVAKDDWRETKSAAVRLKYLDGIDQAIRRRLENM